MQDEGYVTPEGFKIDVVEVYNLGPRGAAVLVVQFDEDREFHRSAISISANILNAAPDERHAVDHWIYSMAPMGHGFMFAHQGGRISLFEDGAVTEVGEVAANITKLCQGQNGTWIIGRNGFLGQWLDGTFVETPIDDVRDIYHVVEASDGSIWAATSDGGLFRRDGDAWAPIELSTNAELHRIWVENSNEVFVAGSAGTAIRYADGEVTFLSTPDDRNYYCVTRYNGMMLFGAGHLGIERLENGELSTFKAEAKAYEASSNDEILLTCGTNQLAYFNNEKWSAVTYS